MSSRLTAVARLCAMTYGVQSLVIPVVVARTIDGSILQHDRPLWPHLALIGGWRQCLR